MDWYLVDDAVEIISERIGKPFTLRDLLQAVAQHKIKLSFHVHSDLWALTLLPKRIEQAKIILTYGGFESSYFYPTVFLNGAKVKTAILDKEMLDQVKEQARSALVSSPNNSEELSLLHQMIDVMGYESKLDSLKDQLKIYPENWSWPFELQQVEYVTTKLVPEFEGVAVVMLLEGREELLAILEYENYQPLPIPTGVYDLSLIGGGLKDLMSLLNKSAPGLGKTYLSNIEESAFYRVIDRDIANPKILGGKFVVPNKPIPSVLVYLLAHPGVAPCIRKTELHRYLSSHSPATPGNVSNQAHKPTSKKDDMNTSWVKELYELFVNKKMLPFDKANGTQLEQALPIIKEAVDEGELSKITYYPEDNGSEIIYKRLTGSKDKPITRDTLINRLSDINNYYKKNNFDS